MKTRDRILQASLTLFNTQGERNVTTNHIAAHLNMSPGNLYYHFKNKNEIIYDLYLQYEALVDSNLKLPEDRPIVIQDKLVYLKAIFQGLWDYRFIHRDLQHLLLNNDALHQRYHLFFKRCLHQSQAIFKRIREANIIEASDEELSTLSLNTWILVTSWFGFLHTNLLVKNTTEESQELLEAGIFQVFALERPYLTEAYRQPVADLAASLGPSLDELAMLK